MVKILSLPPEILTPIIASTLPYDFENLALASKHFYVLSRPFLSRHNTLRSRFKHFEYGVGNQDPFRYIIQTAWELIVCIAAEPIISEYIIHADFQNDSILTVTSLEEPIQDVHTYPNALSLLQASRSLQTLHIEPQWFLEAIASDLRKASPKWRYSQAAAVFVLSLLPHLQSLKLPSRWEQDPNAIFEYRDHTKVESLLDLLVRKAADGNTPSPASLSQVSRVTFSCVDVPGSKYHSLWNAHAVPFLVLPRIETLIARECVNVIHGVDERQLRNGSKLETLRFENCYFSSDTLSETLEHFPRLKVLTYSQANKQVHHFVRWKILEFFDIVGRKVGGHLEELSISAQYHTGVLLFQDVDMNNFKRLRKLEFGLELAVRIYSARKDGEGTVPDCEDGAPGSSLLYRTQPLLAALVPSTVVELSLLARETFPATHSSPKHERFANALALMFDGFAANKNTIVPNLETLYLDCAADAEEVYKLQCVKVKQEVEQTNVVLHIRTPARFLTEKKDLRFQREDSDSELDSD